LVRESVRIPGGPQQACHPVQPNILDPNPPSQQGGIQVAVIVLEYPRGPHGGIYLDGTARFFACTTIGVLMQHREVVYTPRMSCARHPDRGEPVEEKVTGERLYTIAGSSLLNGRVVWQFSSGNARTLLIRLTSAGHENVRLHALPVPMNATAARGWMLGRNAPGRHGRHIAAAGFFRRGRGVRIPVG